MSLRDDLLEEKRKQKEQEEAAERSRQVQSQQEEQRIQKETQKRNAEMKIRFETLKNNVKNGNVPEEWTQIYDKYIEKIKAALSGDSEEFSFTESVTKEYYDSKENFRDGSESERTLLNSFLTQKLKDEGFKNVIFELHCRTERYSTEEDYNRQARQQEEYDKEADAKYWADVANYNNGGYEYMAAPDRSERAYRPKKAKLGQSGVSCYYEFVVSGSLYAFNNAKRKKASKMSNLSFILPLVFAAIGFVGGFWFYANGGLLGVETLGVFAPVICAIAGGLLGVMLASLERSFRSIYSVIVDDSIGKSFKLKRTLINLIWLLIKIAIVAAIVYGIIYAVSFNLN